MASLEHQTRTPRERLSHNGHAPAAQPTPAGQHAPTESEPQPDPLSRLAFTVWLLAFAFLGSLALWDLIRALLFR